jgi:anaerobic magnesium-protoporphyrin IX monomethyl ester cyclase
MAKVLLLRTFEGLTLFNETKTVKKLHPPFAPPLSLLYIASSLVTHEHDVDFIDVTCESDPYGMIKQKLKDCNAIILNLIPGNQNASATLTKFIRENNPDVPIIIEGNYCTINPINAMNHILLAEVCINGEGEHIINDVINAFEGKGSLKQIPGLLIRDKERIITGKPPHLIKDLDIIPIPLRQLTKQYDYGMMNGIHLCKPKFTSIITSRGCPHHCRFCNTNYINGSYRQRSAESIIQELKEINEEYQSVMIEDDNFLADKKRAKEIFNGIIKERIDLEFFIAGARVDSADRSLYRMMTKAGVKFISFGIESGNQEILDYYHKGITISQIKDAIDLANEMGIFTWGNFIFGAPIETKRHFQDTLDFSLSLKLDLAFYRPLSYRYGSELWGEGVKNGYIEDDEDFIYVSSKNSESNLSTYDISTFCKKAFKRFYFRPTYIIQELSRSIKRNDFTIPRSLFSASV